MEFNKETMRLVQEAEKQRLLAQKVQQENTTLWSQFELLKERNQIWEGINKDNNYLKEFLEADEREKRYYNQVQSQLIRDRDIIRDLEKQREKLESTDTLWLLTNEQKAFRDNLHKSGVGYNGPCVLSQAYAKIPKLYRASELCDKNEQLHVFDSEETLEYAEQKRSAEQTFCSSSCISSVSKTSSEKFASKTKPSMASMPSANPMLVILIEMDKYYRNLLGLFEKNHKRESIFYTSKEEQRLLNVCIEGKNILREWQTYFEAFQNLFQRDIKEMKDAFEQNDVYLDEIENQNDLLKDQLLEASLTKDIKNLVITSCMEIKNKDLHDEIERISKESNDVSFEVTQGLSKRIVELEKDLSKSEAKSIAFEIALQHKSRENNSLKTVQKENENFMASLQLENAHLKQTYKDLFESVQRSKVEIKQCDEVKVKDDFDEIETRNIELEYRVASLIKENEHLKLTYKNLFDSIKIDVQKSLSKPVTTQSLPKNEKDQLLKRIAYLESKLASQDIRSCQKEYHELRTSYNALKVKFDSLNRQKWNINVSKSSKPKESVSEKVHTGESSKPFSRRVSQFTTYSLQKDRKFSKKSQSFETFSPHKGFKTRASNENNQSFETSHSCFTPVKQVWSPIKESQTFEASSSQKSFKTSTFKGKNHVFVTPHSRFTPVKQVWRPKQSHSKSFKYSKSEMLSMQNKNDFASTINKKGRVSNETNFQDVSSNDINKWKSSSSTRFKTPFETPSFKNQWNIKRNFKSPLIPRELFSNETPVSSPRWNSTSLHRLDTTFNWFSKFGKPVSTVLKWVPKVVV
ncbi:hypothetical protein Tco_0575821 [Tanacetum coccineum]